MKKISRIGIIVASVFLFFSASFAQEQLAKNSPSTKSKGNVSYFKHPETLKELVDFEEFRNGCPQNVLDFAKGNISKFCVARRIVENSKFAGWIVQVFDSKESYNKFLPVDQPVRDPRFAPGVENLIEVSFVREGVMAGKILPRDKFCEDDQEN